MTIERLRAAYLARPFLPFVIHMADGREIPVLSPEFMAFSQSGRTVLVEGPNESFHILDLLLMTGLTFKTDSTTAGPASGETAGRLCPQPASPATRHSWCSPGLSPSSSTSTTQSRGSYTRCRSLDRWPLRTGRNDC